MDTEIAQLREIAQKLSKDLAHAQAKIETVRRGLEAARAFTRIEGCQCSFCLMADAAASYLEGASVGA